MHIGSHLSPLRCALKIKYHCVFSYLIYSGIVLDISAISRAFNNSIHVLSFSSAPSSRCHRLEEAKMANIALIDDRDQNIVLSSLSKEINKSKYVAFLQEI